jgi:cytoskeletal protein CcmA (bactofilin family)
MDPIQRLSRVLLAATLVSTSMLAVVGGGAVLADDFRCVGTKGSRTFDGNVIVPRGKWCKLDGTTVKGNVEIKANATVILVGARIDGNVQSKASDVRKVVVRDRARIDGDVQVDNGGRVVVKGSAVAGNIQLKGNRRLSTVNGNTVDGDIQLFSNPGGFEVWRNRVDGNLQCKGNGDPRRGDDNIVQGDKEGQCRGR